jgi:hypothetical protein
MADWSGLGSRPNGNPANIIKLPTNPSVSISFVAVSSK